MSITNNWSQTPMMICDPSPDNYRDELAKHTIPACRQKGVTAEK